MLKEFWINVAFFFVFANDFVQFSSFFLSDHVSTTFNERNEMKCRFNVQNLFKRSTHAILLKRRCYTPFLQQFFAFDLPPKHCCIPFYLKLEWFIIKNWFSCWICIEYFQFDLRRKHCRIQFYMKISESTLNTVVP